MAKKKRNPYLVGAAIAGGVLIGLPLVVGLVGVASVALLGSRLKPEQTVVPGSSGGHHG